jgi:hypothetical protein
MEKSGEGMESRNRESAKGKRRRDRLIVNRVVLKFKPCQHGVAA